MTREVLIAMVRRTIILTSICVLVGSGCHAGRPARVANTESPTVRADITATRFVQAHNRNAAGIRSLTARPRINPVTDGGRQRMGRAYGKLALDGQKNFRLEMEMVTKKLADIGSNDEGFWFWVDDDPAHAIYVCDYKDINSCQLGATLQPDWIMEAMGLRQFTESEARTIHTASAPTPGRLILTQSRKDAKGQLLTKETVVNESSMQILEHRLYSGTNRELLASAVVSQYKPYKVSSGGPEGEAIETTVQIPDRLRLTWMMEKDKFTLDITMADVNVNPSFNPEVRALLFSEPKIAGTTRQDLALLDPAKTPASRVYESRPIPNSGGICLGTPQPSPITNEGATRRQIDPLPLGSDLPEIPAHPAGVVGAVVPRGSYLGH